MQKKDLFYLFKMKNQKIKARQVFSCFKIFEDIINKICLFVIEKKNEKI
tara:strand:- start:3137 stop:3283 length:147 start_codon:yes stop_codon:yes gene_type:complete